MADFCRQDALLDAQLTTSEHINHQVKNRVIK